MAPSFKETDVMTQTPGPKEVKGGGEQKVSVTLPSDERGLFEALEILPPHLHSSFKKGTAGPERHINWTIKC